MALKKSWVTSANSPETGFPLNNLPYGVFSTGGAARCGVAIGDMILTVDELGPAGIFEAGNWNAFMALGPKAWAAFRAEVQAALSEGAEVRPLVAQAGATMHMPFAVAEYTDFYAGRQHAENMGEILRGTKGLPANWLHIPIGYNGRASSVVVSGTDIRRPLGQLGAGRFGPCQKLDIELELGAIVGTGSRMGQPVSVAEADEMIFGYVLLNDWSARDIQGWEYQPLGPFQSKAFATSISPWIVTKAALEAFRKPTPLREELLLPYLNEQKPGLYDIELEVQLAGETISHTNATRLYYSAAQQLTHHSIGGCPMRVGDLLGSGTISGPLPAEFGSLMELSWNGAKPFTLANGETRSFIEDGDTLTLTGHAQGDGFRIGFGECSGTILPAINTPDWAT
ncbi:MAG: fumarylacetoacetase [Rhodobacteraceae bacterium]|nr:fumarylacetoacetase [Paracoccaceae bacterium]